MLLKDNGNYSSRRYHFCNIKSDPNTILAFLLLAIFGGTAYFNEKARYNILNIVPFRCSVGIRCAARIQNDQILLCDWKGILS